MKIEQLKEYVLNHSDLVTMKESVTYPGLFVLKYKRKVFYSGNWNRYLEKCRGLVVDKDFNIVVHPFDKIYNYGIEKDAPILNDDELVLAVKKYNGFMAAASKYNGEIIVSTTGSLDSDYAKLAREMILRSFTENDKTFLGNKTYIFEICHSSDPHIIPEKEGIYILGSRTNSIDSTMQYNSVISNIVKREKNDTLSLIESVYSEFDKDYSIDKNLYHPFPTLTNLGKLKERVKTVKTEGYVFYTADGKSSKIKSPYYLFLKFLARCSKTEKLLHKDDKKNLPEEFYPVIDHVQENVEEFALLSEQDRLYLIRNIFEKL